jgi:hypothetical protein
VLAGDSTSIKNLRDDLKGPMSKGPRRETFDLLTSGSPSTGGVDAAALTSQFAEVSEFQSAITSYSDKPKSVGLNNIN